MRKIQKFAALLLTLLCLLPTAVRAESLIPGGEIIGLELGTGTVTVTGIDPELGAAAQEAGLEPGDQILRIDGKKIASAQDVSAALERSDGTVTLTVLRSGTEQTLRLAPTITKEGPKLGVYLRQGITGIGTVTYYDPEDNRFGALGHGVTEAGGKLLSMTRGSVYRATVLSLRKGLAGTPGQLFGSALSPVPCGALLENTAYGVFGKLDALPGVAPVETAPAEAVHTGPAVIRSTVSGETVREYSVEILKIYPDPKQPGRNLLIRVTDPGLLETTGGIVQGMSGSPILQDGKLIGAVTHVLVNQPDTGYGIFIENMLEAADTPAA